MAHSARLHVALIEPWVGRRERADDARKPLLVSEEQIKRPTGNDIHDGHDGETFSVQTTYKYQNQTGSHCPDS